MCNRLVGQAMFQLADQAAEMDALGESVVHFEIGDPVFDTPGCVIDRAVEALTAGKTHYTSSAGLVELREKAAEVTERSRGFRPTLRQLLVTAGVNVQLFYAMACCVDEGGEIVLPDPGFVSYQALAKMLNLKVRTYRLDGNRGFRPVVESVEKAMSRKTRMIVVNSPGNPTGTVWSEGELGEVYRLACRCDAYVLSDEIYARLVYGDSRQKHVSMGTFDGCRERVIVANGFSKAYAMTGWRLGVLTGPEEVVEKMRLVLETTSSCVSPFVQIAGLEALGCDQADVNWMKERLEHKRDLMLKLLGAVEWVRAVKPEGAFYVMVNIEKVNMDGWGFANEALRKGKVCVCPGEVFGEEGRGWVRLCFAVSDDAIQEGVKRLGDLCR